MSATPLNNGSFQASHNKQQQLSIVARLLAQGTVLMLVMALGWWGMWNVGSDALASESNTFTAMGAREELGGRGVGKGKGCSHEGSSHPITSRQPGVGLGGQVHGAERQRDD
jgi:hypothetical protein